MSKIFFIFLNQNLPFFFGYMKIGMMKKFWGCIIFFYGIFGDIVHADLFEWWQMNLFGSGGPDLIITDIKVDSPTRTYLVGDSVSIWAKVKNQGGRQSDNFRIQVYVDATEKNKLEFPVNYALNPGKYWEGIDTINLKKSQWIALGTWVYTKPGFYTIRVVADGKKEVTETNENNNEKTLTINVTTNSLVGNNLNFSYLTCEEIPFLMNQTASPHRQLSCKGQNGNDLKSSVGIRWYGFRAQNDYPGIVIKNADLQKKITVFGTSERYEPVTMHFDCNDDGVFEENGTLIFNKAFDLSELDDFNKENCTQNKGHILLALHSPDRVKISKVSFSNRSIKTTQTDLNPQKINNYYKKYKKNNTISQRRRKTYTQNRSFLNFSSLLQTNSNLPLYDLSVENLKFQRYYKRQSNVLTVQICNRGRRDVIISGKESLKGAFYVGESEKSFVFRNITISSGTCSSRLIAIPISALRIKGSGHFDVVVKIDPTSLVVDSNFKNDTLRKRIQINSSLNRRTIFLNRNFFNFLDYLKR